MGNNSSIRSQFDQDELKRLGKRFNKIDTDDSRTLTLAEFESIPGLDTNPLLERVFSIIDADNNGHVDFNEFIQGLLNLSVNNDNEAKLKFAFKIYDLDKDGFITKLELYKVLKMMIGNNIKDFQLKQLIKRTIIYADKDKDDKLSYEEFKSIFTNNESFINDISNESNIKI